MKGIKGIGFLLAGLAALFLSAAGAFFFMSWLDGGRNSLTHQMELGQRYLLEENYEKAIVAFEKAIEIEPRQMAAYLGLARAYIGDGQEEEAVSVLEAAQQQIAEVFDPEEAVFEEAEEALFYLAALYEDREEQEKVDKVIKQIDRVRQERADASEEEYGDKPGDRTGLAERKEDVPQVTAYQIYEAFSPLLNWNLVSWKIEDMPQLDTMKEAGHRQTFANTCFLYAEELCPDASLANQAEQYAAYNRIFAGENAELGYIDREWAREESKKDWTAELTPSGEDYSVSYEVKYEIHQAYDLEELNQAYRALFGELFQPFTPEELEFYNFYYDEVHGIACRKGETVIYGDVMPCQQFVHNYVRDIRQDGETIEFTMDHYLMEIGTESWAGESENTVHASFLEEVPELLEANPGANIVLNYSWPIVLDGSPVPLLYSVSDEYAYIDRTDYKDGLSFVTADRRERIWNAEAMQEEQLMSKEEVFAALQENVEELQADASWKPYYSIPYSVHFKVRQAGSGFEILSMEKEEKESPDSETLQAWEAVRMKEELLRMTEAEIRMKEAEIHALLVAHYADDPAELTVLEGELNGTQYTCDVRAGVPGNPEASQRIYEISVDLLSGTVYEHHVIFNRWKSFELY